MSAYLNLACWSDRYGEPTNEDIAKMFYVVRETIELSAEDIVMLFQMGIQAEQEFLVTQTLHIDLM